MATPLSNLDPLMPAEKENNQPAPTPSLPCDDKALAFKWLVGSIIIGALLIAGSIFYSANLFLKKLNTLSTLGQNVNTAVQPSAPSAPSQAQPFNFSIQSDTPVLGNPAAKVLVVEYADYQCPFCERFFSAVLPQLKSEYIATGKIKFVFQDFAFLGPESITAAEAAHCANEQGQFWQFHDYLYNHQAGENQGAFTAAKLESFAKILKLNADQFKQCLDSNKYQQQVLNETNAGKNYGVTGTPTIFVNNKMIVGVQPLSDFEQAINQALGS